MKNVWAVGDVTELWVWVFEEEVIQVEICTLPREIGSHGRGLQIMKWVEGHFLWAVGGVTKLWMWVFEEEVVQV